MCRRLVGSVLAMGLAVLVGLSLPAGVDSDTPAKAKAAEVVRKLNSVRIISIQDADKINAIDQCYLLPSSPKDGAFRNWWGSWGCHQVVFYGNLREPIQEVAALTGFQAVEGKE